MHQREGLVPRTLCFRPKGQRWPPPVTAGPARCRFPHPGASQVAQSYLRILPEAGGGQSSASSLHLANQGGLVQGQGQMALGCHTPPGTKGLENRAAFSVGSDWVRPALAFCLASFTLVPSLPAVHPERVKVSPSQVSQDHAAAACWATLPTPSASLVRLRTPLSPVSYTPCSEAKPGASGSFHGHTQI